MPLCRALGFTHPTYELAVQYYMKYEHSAIKRCECEASVKYMMREDHGPHHLTSWATHSLTDSRHSFRMSPDRLPAASSS